MSHAVFAPGKVVVVGEYAVVDGAQAVVAAVPIGVVAAWEPAPDRHIVVPGGDDRFVRAALDACDAGPGRYTFADHGGPALASKPGLGGSAAATVAAVHLARALGRASVAPEHVFAVAEAVHRNVQGSGSGIDVAASTWGGLLRFTRGEAPVPLAPVPLCVVWSGQSARTGPRVTQYLAWSGRASFVAASGALVQAFPADPIGALEENRRMLEAMAEAAGLDYRTPALDRIGALARAHGGAAKPSGAGGGDCAVACLPDDAARVAFAAACAAEGWVVLTEALAPGVAPLPHATAPTPPPPPPCTPP